MLFFCCGKVEDWEGKKLKKIGNIFGCEQFFSNEIGDILNQCEVSTIFFFLPNENYSEN